MFFYFFGSAPFLGEDTMSEIHGMLSPVDRRRCAPCVRKVQEPPAGLYPSGRDQEPPCKVTVSEQMYLDIA